jgi:hypothetical protein
MKPKKRPKNKHKARIKAKKRKLMSKQPRIRNKK